MAQIAIDAGRSQATFVSRPGHGTPASTSSGSSRSSARALAGWLAPAESLAEQGRGTGRARDPSNT